MEHEHGHETPTQHEIHHAQHEKGIGCQSLDGHETTFSNGEKEQGHILGSQNETTEKEGTMNSSCNTGANVQVRCDVGKIQSEQSEDMMLPISLKRPNFQEQNSAAIAMSHSKGYLDETLTVEVDPNLRGSHQFPNSVPTTVTRPPNISTLRQWGQLVIPSGKHAGKTFMEAHEDLGYVHQIWNRKAVSSWLRSFQMFCRMYQKLTPSTMTDFASEESVEPMMGTSSQSQGAIQQQTRMGIKVAQAMPQPAPSSTSPPSATEWTHIEAATAQSNRAPKRGSKTAEGSRMSTEANQQKVQALRTQIAILQRELANELQIPDDSSDEKTQK